MNQIKLFKKVLFSGLLLFSILSYAQNPFITTWQTDNEGDSGPTEIILPLPNNPIGFNYDVYWEEVGNPTNNGSATGLTGIYTINVASPGTYRVEITGDFPHFTFQGGIGDHDKLLTVEQWGDIQWQNMSNMFRRAANFTLNATDTPDLTNVTFMLNMFNGATSFNSSIDNWEVGNVTNMLGMFSSASSFNQDLSNWDVSNVTNMTSMFRLASSFNGDITTWTTTNLSQMSGMFDGASAFNQDISGWNTSLVSDMSRVFAFATSFNQPLDSWEVSGVTNMSEMFFNASSFNQDLNSWITTNVTDMQGTFKRASVFDGQISNWDVSNVEDMSELFWLAEVFNQDISEWTVTSVDNMSQMFERATLFNQNISGWDVSGVSNMSRMFNQADAFNQPIGSWIVSSVLDMNQMFRSNDAFNQDLSSWDVSQVSNFNNMFAFATAFDQSLGNWDISSAADLDLMLSFSGLSTENYDQTLIGWSNLTTIPSNIVLGAGGVNYCTAETERQNLITNNGWTIDDAGPSCAGGPVLTIYSGVDNTGMLLTNGQTTAIDFGSAEAGNTLIETFSIENTGNAPLTISSIDIVNASFTTNTSSLTVSQGGQETFTIDLSSTVEGTYFTTVTIVSNDPSTNSFEFPITGAITAPQLADLVVYQGTGINASQIISGQPASIEFGNSLPGEDSTLTFTIENKGTSALTINSINTQNSAFSVVSSITSIAAGGTETFTITLSSFVEGSFVDVVTINSDDPDEGTFNFDVRGTVSTPQLTDTIIGKSANDEVTVSWRPENETEVIEYNLYSSTLKSFSPEAENLVATVSAPDTFYIDSPAIQCDSIYYKVTVVNLQGVEGEPSEELALYVSCVQNENYELIIYEGLSPNGDTKNEVLKIDNIDKFPGHEVFIINRWGHNVAHFENYDNVKNAWDGTNQSTGKLLPDGVYYCVVKQKGENLESAAVLLKSGTN